MLGQYEELSCPFCDKGRIPCLYFPSQWSLKRKLTQTLPGRGSPHKSAEVWIIKSGCKECSKPQEEVEKELKRTGVI